MELLFLIVMKRMLQRTNLAASAEAFLQSVSSGAIANLPTPDLRLRHRTVSPDGNGLVPAPANEASESDLREMFSRISSEWAFGPISRTSKAILATSFLSASCISTASGVSCTENALGALERLELSALRRRTRSQCQADLNSKHD